MSRSSFGHLGPALLATLLVAGCNGNGGGGNDAGGTTGGSAAGAGGTGTGGVGGTSSAGCPSSEPLRFDPSQRQDYDACSSVGSVCRYGTDCCACVQNAGCAPVSFWWCVPQVAGCPLVAPAIGSTCPTQGQQCVYCDQSGTWFQLCNAGTWAGRNMLGCT